MGTRTFTAIKRITSMQGTPFYFPQRPITFIPKISHQLCEKHMIFPSQIYVPGYFVKSNRPILFTKPTNANRYAYGYHSQSVFRSVKGQGLRIRLLLSALVPSRPQCHLESPCLLQSFQCLSTSGRRWGPSLIAATSTAAVTEQNLNIFQETHSLILLNYSKGHFCAVQLSTCSPCEGEPLPSA